MKKYKQLFFDLDHTIWDFDRNSSETLQEICANFQLEEQYGISTPAFVQTYLEINLQMWKLLRENKINKEEMRKVRFVQALARFNVKHHGLASQIADYYLDVCPSKPYLIADSIDVLKELAAKYPLHLLTNGFVETQNLKIDSTGIRPFFKHIFIAEAVGFKKPQPEMFGLALNRVGAQVNDCLMIGDDSEADIRGAASLGMDQVRFNPEGKENSIQPTYEIKALKELLQLL